MGSTRADPRRRFSNPPPLLEQTRKEALEHYRSKGAFVKKNLETLQATIEKKQENVQMVVDIMMCVVHLRFLSSRSGGARLTHRPLALPLHRRKQQQQQQQGT